ncbi:MAG: AI-2E family transporter [Haloplanus sp.]
MSLPDLRRYHLGWWSLGLALGAAVAFVVYSFIGTFVFGVFLYYATRPIYSRLRRVIRPASLAAVSLFALALPALALVAYALSIGVRELLKYVNGRSFDLSRWPFLDPQTLNHLVDPATLVGTDLEQFLTNGNFQSLLGSVSSAANTLTVVGVGAVHLFVMLALAFYLLRDGRRLSKWILSRFGDDRGVLEAYLRAVDNDFNNIFFGNILNAVLTGAIGVVSYSLLNAYAPPGARIPAAPLIGLLAGVASLIPVVGMKLVYFPVAIYLGAVAAITDPTTLWFVAVFVVVSFIVVDTIPDLVLRPYVSGRSLHVGSLMLAYTFGPLMFGWYGIFLLPMILVLVIHFARLVLPELVQAEPIQPYTVDPSNLTTDPTSRDAEEFDGDSVPQD